MSKFSVSMKLENLKEKLDNVSRYELTISEKEICERFENLYTGAVNDVLREMTFLDQALPYTIMPLKLEMKSCGVAFTIRSNPDPTVEGEMNIRADMLDAIPKSCIVVWDAGDETEASHWGEVMTASAIARGARGVVINGGLRDTKQVIEQKFPVFYKYRTSNGSLGRTKITGFNTPLRIGKTYIKPGDFIFGDIDGVIVIPRAMAENILIRAEEIKKGEKEIRSWVKEGFSAKGILKDGGYF